MCMYIRIFIQSTGRNRYGNRRWWRTFIRDDDDDDNVRGRARVSGGGWANKSPSAAVYMYLYIYTHTHTHLYTLYCECVVQEVGSGDGGPSVAVARVECGGEAKGELRRHRNYVLWENSLSLSVSVSVSLTLSSFHTRRTSRHSHSHTSRTNVHFIRLYTRAYMRVYLSILLSSSGVRRTRETGPFRTRKSRRRPYIYIPVRTKNVCMIFDSNNITYQSIIRIYTGARQRTVYVNP